MLRLLKVAGNSLLPHYQDGDYVLVAHPVLAGGIRPGDVVAFHHDVYGVMIKKVAQVLPQEKALFVVGTHGASVDSRRFGPISRSTVLGKVIWHIRQPR